MARMRVQLSTGLPELDRAFRGLMPGDNIVWQVDSIEDYLPFVDGKPRYKGVASFLQSRGIRVYEDKEEYIQDPSPRKVLFGNKADTPDVQTCCGLGNKKQVQFQAIIKRDGADVFLSTVELIKQLNKKCEKRLMKVSNYIEKLIRVGLKNEK